LKDNSVVEDSNHTDTSSYPTSELISYKFTDTLSVLYDKSNWSCYVESLSFNKTYYQDDSSNSNITVEMNITPELYIVHVIDTETNALTNTQLAQRSMTLDFSNYEPGNHTWLAFYNDSSGDYPASFREGYLDSYNGNYTLTWFDMTTRAYWNNTNGYGEDPVYTVFVNDIDWQTRRNMWGDDIEFHFHNHQWYNYTALLEDDFDYSRSPYLPAGYWNQVINFTKDYELGTESKINDTPQENMEAVFSNRILTERQFPSVYRSGWIFMDNNLSTWLEGVIKYSMNPADSSGGIPSEEPAQGFFDWTNVEARDLTDDLGYAYHPNESDYKKIGNMNRTEIYCKPGGIESYWMDDYMDQAYKRSRVIVCLYTHNYGTKTIIKDNANKTIEAIISNIGDYPELKFKYSTAHEAAKWVDRCEDDTPPTLTLTQDASWYYIESNEPLFASPYLAINTTDGKYVRGTVTDNGENKWKASKSEYSINNFLFAAQDLCGNTYVQDVGEDAVDIEYPTNANPVNVNYPQNITVNFTVTNEGYYLTSGVEVINLTLVNETGSYICELQGDENYAGNNIWQQNCSVIDGEGVYNLTIWVNHVDTGEITDTEIGAVRYDTCSCPETPQNWIVDCSDDCLINSACNIAGYNLTLYGTGNFVANMPIILDAVIKSPNCNFINFTSIVFD